MSRPAEEIIIKPALTEKSEILKMDGKYVFWVHPDANRTEVARAIEEIYNRDRKKEKDKIFVAKVNILNVPGKTVRRGMRFGKRRDRKKAIITLAQGSILEDVGA